MQKKKLILVVDDCRGILDTIEMLLGEDHRVVEAPDAWQALQILQDLVPDLIFLDCMMPGISGLQLLREIRQMGIGSRIVIITASVLAEIEEEADMLGVDRLLHKPFDAGQILDIAQGLAA